MKLAAPLYELTAQASDGVFYATAPVGILVYNFWDVTAPGPKVDADTDSDNNGKIDGTQAEDNAELAAGFPGKLVIHNRNDDDADARPDWRNTRSSFMKGEQVVDDNWLEKITISIDAASEDLTGRKFRLSSLNNGVLRLWTTKQKHARAEKDFVIGTDFDLEDGLTVWAEGIKIGNDAVTGTLLGADGSTPVHSDALKFTVVFADLTAYRPKTRHFRQTAVPFSIEENPGAGIRRNGDNDNDNLIKVIIGWPHVTEIKYKLRKSTSNIRIWGNANKTGEVVTSVNNWETWHETDNDGWSDVFVEWVHPAPDPATNQATFDISIWDAVHNKLVFQDTIRFYPFKSIVVALGGEDQKPEDPARQNFGTFRLARQLYDDGYDVHMYDEDSVVFDGSGDVFNDVVKSIQQRLVTEVGIAGYSHGGGSTHDLAKRLDDNKATIGTFTQKLTSYVDAIENDSPTDIHTERHRPPGSQFHMNHFQDAFFIAGGPTTDDGKKSGNPDADWPAGTGGLDVQNETTWGANATHYDVDDFNEVIGEIKKQIKQRVAR